MRTAKRKTWFLVIDSARARIFQSTGPHGDWLLVEEFTNDDARKPSRELGRDRPTRGRTIGTSAPYAIDDESEHEKAGEEFLAARVQDIIKGEKNDRFDQLVIAAAPAALGSLRKKLTPPLTAKLVACYDKDLVNKDANELHRYFTENLWHW